MTPALAPSDGTQTRVDLSVNTSCGREVTCTRRNFATSIHVPASYILVSFSLGASHGFYTWPQIFEWAGADTNQGRNISFSTGNRADTI